MLYKPDYCCNCGEKVERIEWNPLTSRRFCEVCQTEYPLDKLFKIIFPTLLLMFGIFGISGYVQTNVNSVDDYKIEKTSVLPKVKDNNIKKLKTLKTSDVEATESTGVENKGVENQANVTKANVQVEQIDEPSRVVFGNNPQKSVKEAVYFCGAETKKGTPCSRKVKGGGRCWQHLGREAMLSETELNTERHK